MPDLNTNPLDHNAENHNLNSEIEVSCLSSYLNSNDTLLLSSYQNKQIYALKQNLREMIRRYGLERVGLLTLTFKLQVPVPIAWKMLNNFFTGYFRKAYKRYVVILGISEETRIHFHIITVFNVDIRTGTDFTAIQKNDYSAAPATLKRLWKELRKKSRDYGFGKRTHLAPVYNEEAFIKYMAGNVRTAYQYANENREGNPWYPSRRRTRVLSYSQGWRSCSAQHNSVVGASPWRMRLKIIGRAIGCNTFDEFTDKIRPISPRWHIFFRKFLFRLSIPDTKRFANYMASHLDAPQLWEQYVDTEILYPNIVALNNDDFECLPITSSSGGEAHNEQRPHHPTECNHTSETQALHETVMDD